MNQTGGAIAENTIPIGVSNQYLDPLLYSDHWSGILVQSCSDMSVWSNTIARPLNTNSGFEITSDAQRDLLRGIVVDNSHGVDIFNNDMYNMAAGTRVYDDCQYRTELHCNNFNACNVGVNFSQVLMDPQGDVNNPTNNAWYDFATRNRIDGTIAGIPVDWYFNPLTPELDIPFFGPVIAPQPTSVNTIGECFDPSDPYPDPSERQANLIRLIQDSLFVTYGDETIFRNHEEAFRVLSQNDTLLTYGNDTVLAALQDFYTLTSLSNIGILADIREYITNNDMADALLRNSQLNTENLMEENSRFINEIVIASAEQPIALDSMQHAQLVDIAFQIPHIGGEAVYRARAILKMDVDDTQLNYRLANTGAGQNTIHHTNSIYPNPNNGTFFLNCMVDDEHPAIVEMRDVTGRIIMVKQLDEGNEHQVQMQNTTSGIYFLYLRSKGDNKVFKMVLNK